jgi:hypothetical protein
MKTIRTLAIALALVGALSLATTVRATLVSYDIAFTDPTASNVAQARVDVNIVGGLAESGWMNVLNGVAAGSYNLVPTTGPGVNTSPLGAFFYDNLVFGLTTVPFLDDAGLLFSRTVGSVTTELNLWGTGPGNNGYTLYGYSGGVYSPQVTGGAAISIAVPEPTTMIAGALLLLPFGASTLRMLRKSRTA